MYCFLEFCMPSFIYLWIVSLVRYFFPNGCLYFVSYVLFAFSCVFSYVLLYLCVCMYLFSCLCISLVMY